MVEERNEEGEEGEEEGMEHNGEGEDDGGEEDKKFVEREMQVEGPNDEAEQQQQDDDINEGAHEDNELGDHQAEGAAGGVVQLEEN